MCVLFTQHTLLKISVHKFDFFLYDLPHRFCEPELSYVEVNVTILLQFVALTLTRTYPVSDIRTFLEIS